MRGVQLRQSSTDLFNFDQDTCEPSSVGADALLSFALTSSLVFILILRILQRCYSSGHHFEWSRALLVELGMRQWLAWQHLVAHRSVVHKDRLYRGRLRQVRGLQALKSVHVGMMCARTIVHPILNELETGDTHGVERFMVDAVS